MVSMTFMMLSIDGGRTLDSGIQQYRRHSKVKTHFWNETQATIKNIKDLKSRGKFPTYESWKYCSIQFQNRNGAWDVQIQKLIALN